MAAENTQFSRFIDDAQDTLPKKFSFIEETIPISIKFQNLSYCVKEKRSKFKQLLDGVSGYFSTGEFTAILGASGCGKTTLLNILSGYVKKNVKGTIEVNEKTCNVKLLRKLSAYIMQNDLLQPHLTVEEQMMIVAKLKLPNSLEEKKIIVNEFVDVFNLRDCYETRVEKISGGERKRLSIALELISNPPVIFLDEPMSGLDSVTINSCMEIFRQLSSAGRTVICTIHQPSVPIMNQFDQVYFLARGSCIYNGSTENILPFLTSLNLTCPITSSYSEFVIETVETNPETIQFLSNAIENGKTNYRKPAQTKNKVLPKQNQKIEKYYNSNKFHPCFWTQFIIIFRRMMLQQSRNKVGLLIQLFTYGTIAVIFGLAFFGIGNNARTLISNVFFSWMVIMFFLYNPVMVYITVFPIEMEILRREYLNRWYSFKAYYLALSLRSLPLLVVLGPVALLIVYLLSDQPLEIDRFFRFTLACLLVSITSEGLGLLIGCTFGTLGGTILGPAILAPIAMIPLYGFGFGSAISTTVKMIMRLSYMRFAYIAVVYSLMEDRPPLQCFDIFCYYKDTKHLLRDLGISNNSYYYEVLGLIAYGLLFRVAAFLVLRYRMQEELTGKNSDFVAKLLHVKS